MNELLYLENAVENALDWLRGAEIAAGNMLTDITTGEPLPWREMEEALARIVAAMAPLPSCLDPVRGAIEAERARADDGPDGAQ